MKMKHDKQKKINRGIILGLIYYVFTMVLPTIIKLKYYDGFKLYDLLIYPLVLILFVGKFYFDAVSNYRKDKE